MSVLRVLRAEVETGNSARLRVVRAEVATVVAPTSRLRVLSAGLDTIPAPHLRVLSAEVETDVALIANAGVDQTGIKPLTRVYLSALQSSGDPTPEDFEWHQVAGPPVVLEPSANVATPSYVAPATPDGTTCSFTVTARNGEDDPVESAPVNHGIDPHPYWYGRAGQTVPAVHYVGAAS